MKTYQLLIIFFITYSISLFGCDMFMLQSIEDYPFFTLPNKSGEFNDPYDFFEDFKSQADQSSGNRDGYGIIAYESDNPFVQRDYMWYKTGIGNFFNEDNLDEPLYQAMSTLYDNTDINRVLVHARSGTGGNGNHPFMFNTNSSTYSFMHNGYIFNSAKQNLINFLGKDWFIAHPSQWEGDYTSANTFIDSEVIFHYLMYYVLQYPDDIPTAFRHAFNNKQVNGVDMEFVLKFNNNNILNFVFSDGTETYIYRSSKLMGTTYNLSYQIYSDNFIAVKTGTNLSTTLEQNQLVRITPQGEIIDLSIEPILRTNFVKKFVEPLDIDQYKLRWTVESNTQINKFKVYRSNNQNFTLAEHISSILVGNNNQTQFQYLDTYASNLEHFYWIEVVFDDETSELTSNIPSYKTDDEPDIPEVNNIISLFPNPFQENLNIQINSEDDFKIKIFNLKGQLVDKLKYSTEKDEILVWDTSAINKLQIPNGIYLLQFKSNNKTITKKVMRID